MSGKLENAINLYMEGINDGNYIDAINKYTGDRYTQHSTGVKDGKEGFIEFFSSFVERNPIRNIKIIRKLEDGNKVFLQALQNINNGETRWLTTDFFDTDNDDKIIEHWDVISEFTEDPLANNNSLEGPTEVRDLEMTKENKDVINNLFNEVLLPGRDLNKIEKYVQNSKSLIKIKERQINYKELVLLVGQGNFVATLSRANSIKGSTLQEYAQVDLFMIKEGLITQHWDNFEPVPEISVNSGKF